MEDHLETNSFEPSPISLTNAFEYDVYSPEVHLVGSKPDDYIFNLSTQQYLIKKFNASSVFEGGWGGPKRDCFRLSTSLADRLGETLFTEGLEKFLSLITQMQPEDPVGITFTNIDELSGPYDNPAHIDFSGSYGEYYTELFFHIPFLIASSLNANQKFKEAKWWYERIFNPTASDSPASGKPKDRSWRYIEFTNLDIKKIKEILTNGMALEQYRKDPFNPHAIARLRISAYQKTIVMKYIDNLLDWGDYLFAQDTMESINEATMLYVLASDILGKRPSKLGSCKTAEEKYMTYSKIHHAIHSESDFLIYLENWSQTNIVTIAIEKYNTVRIQNSELLVVAGDNASEAINTEEEPSPSVNLDSFVDASFDDYDPTYNVNHYNEVIKEKENNRNSSKKWKKTKRSKVSPGNAVVKQSVLAFCVPPNQDFLNYWDRVEDRLFKIHNCMNISGRRRQLALFQPPIDPMMLVRAKAAGLSLEEIVPGGKEAELPPYRFRYLIEKAKQFTQTVQNFGSALLSALEKKDVEELTLLRSVHERHILKMTRAIKEKQVKEAQSQYQAIVEGKVNVQNRINYYQGLIDEGLIPWENIQQVTKHTATGLQAGATVLRALAAKFYLAPQVGSPFAFKYGGKEIGDSTNTFANFIASLVSTLEMISASAGLVASNERREQEWNQQLTLAEQELKQVEKQELAADIRQQIAEKDLDIHLKNIEHAEELDRFFKNKFTNLGLYNYLSSNLNRLYREAYNLAFNIAKMAETTYEFESGDNTTFIVEDNWQFDRAGLLAGERLLLQLQQMEEAYIKQDKRDHEITQSFSLALFDPLALMNLKQKGESGEFRIPEIMFDFLYPGHFKRLIKSVRLTIPCVAGPYNNVSAILALKNSYVKKTSTDKLVEVKNEQLMTSIATSSAQGDSGILDFNFRDERYLPFEGAGAISSWELDLPSKIRSFDYDTISDVIIHVSYTARYDVDLKRTVEGKIATDLTAYASSADGGLYRLISLKHEFPDKLYELLNPPSDTAKQLTQFELGQNHFPYFLVDKKLKLSNVTVFLQPKHKDTINTSELVLEIKDAPAVDWKDFDKNLKLKQADIPSLIGTDPIKKDWKVDAGIKGLDKEKIGDMLILLKYNIS